MPSPRSTCPLFSLSLLPLSLSRTHLRTFVSSLQWSTATTPPPEGRCNFSRSTSRRKCCHIWATPERPPPSAASNPLCSGESIQRPFFYSDISIERARRSVKCGHDNDRGREEENTRTHRPRRTGIERDTSASTSCRFPEPIPVARPTY